MRQSKVLNVWIIGLVFLLNDISPVYAQWMQTAGPKLLTQTGWEYIHTSSLMAGRSRVGDTLLFAGTYKGAFISSDNGASWLERNDGFYPPDNPGADVSCFAQYDTIMYAGLFAGFKPNIYASTDDGLHWRELNVNPLGSSVVYDLITVPGHSTHKDLFVATHFIGVYYSSDAGETWEHRNSGIYTDPINHGHGAFALGTIPTDDSSVCVFAGTMSGIYRTTDKGLSWSDASVGLPLTNSWPVTEITTVQTETGETIIFIGTHDGVYRSTNKGDTWEKKSAGLPADQINGETRVESIIALPSDSGIPIILTSLYVGDTAIWKSTDMGESWVSIADGLPFGYAVFSLQPHNSYLYAGLYNGVWRRPLSEIITTGVDEPAAPVAPALPVSYPNPVMSGEKANIAFSLERSSNITLRLYSTLGKEVRLQPLGQLAPGNHTATLATNALPPGVYYYTLYPSSGTALTGKIAVR